jgi:hypothetical protein
VERAQKAERRQIEVMRLAVFAAFSRNRPNGFLQIHFIPAQSRHLFAALTCEQQQLEDRCEDAAKPLSSAPKSSNLIGEDAIAAFDRFRAAHSNQGVRINNALIVRTQKKGELQQSYFGQWRVSVRVRADDRGHIRFLDCRDRLASSVG